MDDTPNPRPFSLPPMLWAVIAVAAGITIYIHLGPLKSGTYAVGYIIGSVVGLCIFPTLISWITWRLGRRSQRAAVIAFLVTLVLVLAGQLSQSQQRHQQKATLDEFTQELKYQRAGLREQLDEKGEIKQQDLEKITHRTHENLGKLAEKTTGEDREIALAMQEFIALGQERQQEHGQAIAALGLESFLNLNRFTTAEHRKEARVLLEDWRRTNFALRDYIANASTHMRTYLENRHVSEPNIKATISGYQLTAAAHKIRILAIRDLDTEMIDLLKQFLDLTEKYEGQWTNDPETGAFILPTDEAVDSYNELINNITATGIQQADMQRKLILSR